MITHIRVGVVRASPRARPYRPGTTLCGAPATPNDITASEARSCTGPADLERFHVCRYCWAARPHYGRPRAGAAR